MVVHPTHFPHFGGLWESAIKKNNYISFEKNALKDKYDFRKIQYSRNRNRSGPQFPPTPMTYNFSLHSIS